MKRALVYRDSGRYKEACEELGKAISSEPDNALAHAMLGYCRMALHEFKAAKRHAKIAIGLDPTMSFPHRVLANIYMAGVNTRAGELEAREAVRVDPTDAEAFGILAKALFRSERYYAAIEAAEEGLRHELSAVARSPDRQPGDIVAVLRQRASLCCRTV